MRAVIDTSTLLLFLDPSAKPPEPPAGYKSADAADRILFLIETLAEKRARLLVPAPVLSELLTKTGEATQGILEQIHATRVIEVVPFDEVAAIECGMMLAARWAQGRRRKGPTANKAKVKFDHQVAAIARVQQVDIVYTDDADLKKLGSAWGFQVLGVWDLPERPKPAQSELPLSDPPPKAKAIPEPPAPGEVMPAAPGEPIPTPEVPPSSSEGCDR